MIVMQTVSCLVAKNKDTIDHINKNTHVTERTHLHALTHTHTHTLKNARKLAHKI